MSCGLFVRNGLRVAVLVLLLALPAGAAEVVEVRVGRHPTFTRVVFELDVPAGYRVGREASGEVGETIVVTLDARSGARQVRSRSEYVESVKIGGELGRTVARIALRKPSLRLKEMILANPPRIVLDVYEPEQLAGAAEAQTGSEPGPAPGAGATRPAPDARTPRAPTPDPDPPRAPHEPRRPAPSPEPEAETPSEVEMAVEPAPGAKTGTRPLELRDLDAAVAPLAGIDPERRTPPAPDARAASKPDAPKPPPAAAGTGLAADADPAPAAPTPTGSEPGEGERTGVAGRETGSPAEVEPPPPPRREAPKAPAAPPRQTAKSPVKVAELPGSGLDWKLPAAAAGGLLAVVLLVLFVLRRRSPQDTRDLMPMDGAPVEPEPEPEAGVESAADVWGDEDEFAVGAAESEPEAERPLAGPAARGLFDDDEDEKGEEVMEPMDTQFAGVDAGGMPPVAADGDLARIVGDLERRLAQAESRLEENSETCERLERQVAAQAEELRVQRAAIARTQRALRSLSRSEEEQATEPALRDPR